MVFIDDIDIYFGENDITPSGTGLDYTEPMLHTAMGEFVSFDERSVGAPPPEEYPQDPLPPVPDCVCPTIRKHQAMMAGGSEAMATVELTWENPGTWVDDLEFQPDPNYQGMRLCLTKTLRSAFGAGGCEACADHWCEQCPTLDCQNMVWTDVNVDFNGYTDQFGDITNWPVNGHAFTTPNTGGFVELWPENDARWALGERLVYCLTAWAYCGGDPIPSFGGSGSSNVGRKYTLCYRGAVTMPTWAEIIKFGTEC